MEPPNDQEQEIDELKSKPAVACQQQPPPAQQQQQAISIVQTRQEHGSNVTRRVRSSEIHHSRGL